MKIESNPDLRLRALEAIRVEYGISAQRPGLHQSELSYCLTKSYWNKTDYTPPDDKAAVMFAIGFAMERVLLERSHPDPIEIDGITMSLDSLTAFEMPVDLKTTRKGSETSGGCGVCGEPYKGHSWASNGHKYVKGEMVPFEMPEGWKRQAAAYRYALNRHRIQSSYDFHFLVIHLVEADATAWTVTFTPQELEDNWNRLLQRKKLLQTMLDKGDPAPFTTNEDWECEHCPYLLRCQLQASQQRLIRD